MFFKKATLPLILVFLMGILGFATQYIPHWRAEDLQNDITKWSIIIGGFALFISMYSLLHMHVTRIRRRMTGWGYSVFVFLGAAVMIVLGLYNGGQGPLAPPIQGKTDWYDWGFNNIQVPCGATIFSILAFFMASAAFRTFRARNLGAALLLLAAIVVMFGRVPISEIVSNWFTGHTQVFASAADTVMDYPNLAAKRGIMMGIALGALSQALRILFGIERSYLGGGD
jgi:hypothetical protein